MADLSRIGSSGSGHQPAEMTEERTGPIGRIMQEFLRTKVGGWLGPRANVGYPLFGGGAWSMAGGDEAPIGHTGTAQITQAPNVPSFGAGVGGSASAVPAIYAGNADITSGGWR